MTFTATEVKYP